ncbi:MAG: single-stranded-DNA-specific exonuclease RecJ [Bacteroidetes bacterium]|nr:single-stranded-DNA-specific exonuclease RecJ [Bacteroidota bacterium]MCL2301813.1 single-stranded-DNA-specific exonuclease RecJ [Lentimicrobiaceae bacterium]
MNKRWIVKNQHEQAVIEDFAKKLNIEEPLAVLLLSRGINTIEEATNFFNPDISKLHDPFLMKNMDIAVERLSQAIMNNEKILVYGDYDVDGTTAVALLYSFLSEVIGADYKKYIEYYIPDRYTEGYGISEKGIEYCRDNNFTLLVSLDCGIKANDKVDLANSYGIDIIICDHHLEGDTLPNAAAILDPKCSQCHYPYKELSGCGVGLKFIQGYCQKHDLPDQLWLSKLDLVAISIASDIVAITGENRILAYYGLIIINRFPRVGVKSIIEQAGIKIQYPPKENTIFSRQIQISDLVFFVGPRINAAGRINTGRESVKLLICEDEDKSLDIGKNINSHNDTRRELDKKATEEAINLILASEEFKHRKSIVLYNSSWNKGIIGIVASRLVEEFYKPVIVITDSPEGLVTGSARSIKEFNIYNGIDHCSDLLEHFGGHKFAAGLSLKKENLEAFSEKFEQYVCQNINDDDFIPEIEVDMELDLGDITTNFMSNLKRFAPFGPENMAPVFMSKSVVEEGTGKIVGDKHIKMRLLYRSKSSQPIDAIAFNQKKHYEHIANQKDFDILYHVEENTWNNVTNIQLNIKDIRINL